MGQPDAPAPSKKNSQTLNQLSKVDGMNQRLIAIIGAGLLVVGGIVGIAALGPSDEAPSAGAPDICEPLDSGKIDTTGDPLSVTVTAQYGFLISEYCVKAGAAPSGGGPVYVQVDPPQKTVVITHPTGKAVSHWSVRYVPDCTKCETTTTVKPTTTLEPTTTIVDPTTTTVVETTTTTSEPTVDNSTTTTTMPATTTTVKATTTTKPTLPAGK